MTGSSQTVSYQYGSDAGGNITSIADSGNAAYNRSFAYDDLNRLTTANSGASLWGNGSYTYDAMGNMVTMSLGSSRSEAFTYSGTTPKIATVSENGAPAVAVSYDSAGNETAIGETTFSYSTRNALLSASTPSLTYTYDGRGLRAFTYGTWASVNPTRYFMYAPELRLLSEHDDVFGPQPPSGLANHSYIWFGTDLIAEIDHTTSATYWVFTDHLGTPLVLTDSGATVVWRAEYEPYGKIFAYRTATASFHQPVRLPGQEAEQYDTVGSDRYYNIFRWYRSGWGRYTQGDSIGLQGGLNLYRYTNGNPLIAADPFGLSVRVICRRVQLGSTFVERLASFWLTPVHCRLAVSCDCDRRDETPRAPFNRTVGMEAVNGGYQLNHDEYLAPQWGGPTQDYDRGWFDVPVRPPTSATGCQFERCILNTAMGREGTNPQSFPTYSIPGPNSNSYVRNLVDVCGGSADWPYSAYGATPNPWWGGNYPHY